MEIIYRKKNNSDSGWDRYFVSAKTGNLDEISFVEPTANNRVELRPLGTKLYLLDYLKFGFPMKHPLTIATVKNAVNSINENILKDVYAIEYIASFSDPWMLSIFSEDVKENNYVAFVALLTEKNTGKELPGRKFPKDRPLGISDHDWEMLVKELSLDK